MILVFFYAVWFFFRIHCRLSNIGGNNMTGASEKLSSTLSPNLKRISADWISIISTWNQRTSQREPKYCLSCWSTDGPDPCASSTKPFLYWPPQGRTAISSSRYQYFRWAQIARFMLSSCMDAFHSIKLLMPQSRPKPNHYILLYCKIECYKSEFYF